MTARGRSAQPWRALPWSIAIVAIAAAFWAGLPWLAQQFPTERPVAPGERIPIQTASYQPPEGWILDIPSAAGARPEVSDGPVRTRAQSGVWFGSSRALVERLAEQLGEAGGTVDALPDAPSTALTWDLDEAPEREDYAINFTIDGEYGSLYVVRHGVSVVLIRATGPGVELTDAAGLIAAMVASVDTGEVSIEDAPPNPRSLPDAGAGLRSGPALRGVALGGEAR